MVIEDTRQQREKHEHIKTWMEAHGVAFCQRSRALPFGDYVSDNGSNVVIDTKKDIQELVMDVGRDHDRFVRECDKARVAGYRLVVLVESSKRYNDRTQLSKWVSKVCLMCRRCRPSEQGRCKKYRSRPMQGETLVKILDAMERRHGVRFEFVPKRDAARRICELLGEEVEG